MLVAGDAHAKKRAKNLVPALCLLLAGLAALVFALYPLYIIRPFREQKPADLQRALWVSLHDRPILVGIFLLIAVLALIAWRRAGFSERLLLAPATAIALIAVAASWFNPFERMMFHAMGQPHYLAIQQANIDAKDMVIVVTLGGDSRAYPIREMGYHHVVNDRLHQLPIVVTY